MEKQVAKALLKIKAVFLKPNDPFTWASGIKSPIYCDNRLTLSHVEERNLIEKALAETVTRYFPEVEYLAGTSTAGIAHAAYVSNILALPMGYVRGSAKDHGRKNQIEGEIPTGKKVVVIEDLISTGGSVIEVVDVLKEANADVLGVVSIFTYDLEKGKKRLAEANLINHSLSNFKALIEVAVEENYIEENDVAKLLKFQSNPSDESWAK